MKYLFVSVALLLSLSAVSTAAEPAPSDFAYGYRLELAVDSPAFIAPVPLEVYRTLTRADLGDMCVFNAKGEVVPFGLRLLKTVEETEHAKVELPMFPVMGEPDKGLDGVSLNVRRDDNGSIINVTTNRPADRSGKAVIAYLLDADGIDDAIVRLELEIAAMPEPGITRLDVEISEDLHNWYKVAGGATVADLHYGAHSLRRDEVELGRTLAYFYRITPAKGEPMPELGGVRAVLAKRSTDPERDWITVHAAAQPGRQDEYSFDTTGRMPVDRLRVKLPQKNTLVEAEFLSRSGPDAGWRNRARALVYGLKVDGSELNNPDIKIAPATDRLWLMRVTPGSGGIGNEEPDIEVGWVPHRLVFVARGEGPFLLAYGSGRAVAGTGGSEGLIAKVDEIYKQYAVVQGASIGEKVVLGGEAALGREIRPPDLKKLLLWAILLSGVVILALMALALRRRMKETGGDN